MIKPIVLAALCLLWLYCTDAFSPFQGRFTNHVQIQKNAASLHMSTRTQSTYNTGYRNNLSDTKFDAPAEPSTQSKLVAYKNPEGVITGMGKADQNGLRNGEMVNYQTQTTNNQSSTYDQNMSGLTNSNFRNQNYNSAVPYYAQDYYYPYSSPYYGYGYGYGYGYPYHYGYSPYYSPFWGYSPWFGYGPYAMMNYYNYWNHWGFWPYGRSYYHWM
jgi:hypothetical protein